MAAPKKPERQPDQPDKDVEDLDLDADKDVEDLDLDDEGITERVRGGRRRMISP